MTPCAEFLTSIDILSTSVITMRTVSGRRIPDHLSVLAEAALLFVPAIPAYLWLWPKVAGTGWYLPVQVASYVYLLAGCLIIGLRRWTLAQLGLSKKGLVLGLACGMALLAARVLVVLSIDLPTVQEAFDLKRLAGELVFYLAFVGFTEELLFRGLIYRALDEWRGARWAIWGSSLLFGLFHLAGFGPLAAFGAFINGCILAAIRWRAGGIVGLIIAHGLIDVVADEMRRPEVVHQLMQPEVIRPSLVLIGTGLLVAIPIYLWKIHPWIDRRWKREP